MPSSQSLPYGRARFDDALRRARQAPGQVAGRARQAGRWAQGRVGDLRAPRFKRPSRKTLTWTAVVLAVLAALVTVFLLWFDWNKMRGPISRFASARLHREVSIDGDLDVRLLTWTPTATVHRLRIAQPAWAGQGDMAVVDKAVASIRLLPLLKGDVFLPLVSLDRPRVDLVRTADGRSNWNFSEKKSSAPAKIPPIQQFVINEGVIRYADQRAHLFVNGTIQARERREGAYAEGFRLDGKGSINGNPFLLDVTGGPMINIDKSRPYPFRADIRAGSTRVEAQGQVTRPFDLGGVTAALDVTGPDLADLYYLTGLALPNTPPYRLAGRLTREETLYRFDGINGRVGDSDLNGKLSVETKGDRPDLNADLTSRVLDLDDLMAIFGGAPDPRETASPVQKAIAKDMAAEQRLLPDAPLQVERLRAMDAVLRYRAQSVRSPTIPVRRAAVDLKLKDGVLDIHDFAFNLTSGQVTGSAKIDARKATPFTDFDARFRGVSIQQFIKTAGPPPITGMVQARARLSGEGDSVRKAVSNANGAISIVVPRGEMRQAFAELLGINAGKGLYLLLSKDPRQTELRCAVADFKVSRGVAVANTIVVDTGVVLARGSGAVNLNTERMDLVLDGESKQPRLLKLWAPITVQGSLRSPKLGVKAEQVAAQAGVGAALGALLSPLAAILPFIDPGMAKDADCAALVGSAAAKGAPVKASSTTQAGR